MSQNHLRHHVAVGYLLLRHRVRPEHRRPIAGLNFRRFIVPSTLIQPGCRVGYVLAAVTLPLWPRFLFCDDRKDRGNIRLAFGLFPCPECGILPSFFGVCLPELSKTSRNIPVLPPLGGYRGFFIFPSFFLNFFFLIRRVRRLFAVG